jgi:hypothetical protein
MSHLGSFHLPPHLTTFDKKLGSGVRVGCYIREFRELKEFREFKEIKEIGSMYYL